MASTSRMSAFAMYLQNSPKELPANEASNKRRPRKREASNNAVEPRVPAAKRRGGRPKIEKRMKKIATNQAGNSEEAENDSDEHNGNRKEDIVENESSDSQNGFVVEVGESPSPPKIINESPNKKISYCGNIAANNAMRCILAPIATDYFFEHVFEKKPFYIRRNLPDHFKGLFSLKDIDKIIKENRLNYGKEIDVVSYVDGKRIPVDNGMIAFPDFVWNSYQEGNSIRMRNPQVYNQPLWQLCSLLQEFFSSCVGCNMYLTPTNSQGFPPHWDDIDAFILQIEGKKHWKVYKPRCESEEFPKYSSGDLEQDEIGEPIMEQEVVAGDTLYIPRGYIHQASASDEHSLHITISTNQLNTWSDLIKLGLDDALKKATAQNVELRRSLPKDYFELAGLAFNSPAKKKLARNPEVHEGSFQSWAFRNTAMELVKEVVRNFSVDTATDMHAINFIHGCMPPCYNKNEGMCSIHWNGNRYRNGGIKMTSPLESDCKVRWIRKRAFRLVTDEEGSKLYHSIGNCKDFKGDEALFLEVDSSALPAVYALINRHPEYIRIIDLPLESDDEKIGIADVLYYNGFLETEVPLPPAE